MVGVELLQRLYVGQVRFPTMTGAKQLRTATAVMITVALIALLAVPCAVGFELGSETHDSNVSAELTYSVQERRRICEEVWRKIGLWYATSTTRASIGKR